MFLFFGGAALFWGFVSNLEDCGGCMGGGRYRLCVKLLGGG